ncbi:hypothetical protein Tco_1278535, partial [Tanacetum coccineum]
MMVAARSGDCDDDKGEMVVAVVIRRWWWLVSAVEIAAMVVMVPAVVMAAVVGMMMWCRCGDDVVEWRGGRVRAVAGVWLESGRKKGGKEMYVWRL